MTFAPSDIDAVSKALSRWELGEYIASALVTVGCIGEYAADFTDWLTGGVKERKEYLAKCSTLLLIVALSLEILCVVRTNQLSGNVIDFLGEKAKEAGEKARDADGEAKTAISDSSTALSQAKDAKAKAQTAQNLLGKAEDESNRAQIAASSALILARDARKEADTFEKDILSAKKQAESAESHLAEALHKAADATRALREEEAKREAIEKRLAPRSFGADRIAALVKLLKQFGPQRIDVMTYPHDTEAQRLESSFLNAFMNAGWKWNRFEPMDSEGITGIFIEVDRSDAKSVKAAQALYDEIKSPDLTVVGPAPTLPRAYRLGYTGSLGTAPDAPIRITIGSK